MRRIRAYGRRGGPRVFLAGAISAATFGAEFVEPDEKSVRQTMTDLRALSQLRPPGGSVPQPVQASESAGSATRPSQESDITLANEVQHVGELLRPISSDRFPRRIGQLRPPINRFIFYPIVVD